MAEIRAGIDLDQYFYTKKQKTQETAQDAPWKGLILLQEGKEGLMDTYITRAEHQEFARRQDEENKRQNKRIDGMEETVRQIGTLTASVEKLAVSIESMAREQEQQGKQLRELEAKDGEMWRKVVGYIATAIIGIVIGFVFKQIGM